MIVCRKYIIKEGQNACGEFVSQVLPTLLTQTTDNSSSVLSTPKCSSQAPLFSRGKDTFLITFQTQVWRAAWSCNAVYSTSLSDTAFCAQCFFLQKRKKWMWDEKVEEWHFKKKKKKKKKWGCIKPKNSWPTLFDFPCSRDRLWRLVAVCQREKRRCWDS